MDDTAIKRQELNVVGERPHVAASGSASLLDFLWYKS